MSFLEKLTGPISKEKPDNKPVPDPKKTEKEIDWAPSETEGQLSVDVFQTPADIVIKSTIAGVKPEHLDIAITNDMVTIRGRRESDDDLKKDDYFYQECYWGRFSRSIILPQEINQDKAEASLRDGVLTIRLPKLERAKNKKLRLKIT